jgi:hypothetical protein
MKILNLTKDELNKVVIYYYVDGDIIYYIDELNDFGTLNSPLLLKTYHSFQMFKGYEKSQNGLKLYKSDYNKWWINILSSTKDINYKQYYNHNHAVKTILNSMIGSKVKKLNMDDITLTEFKYYEKCFNAGLTYFNKKYKDINTNCFGYDFKRFYPTILNSDILIPTKTGVEHKYDTLPTILKYGIYKVKITSDDNNFKKIFSFSKYNYYTHFSINFVLDNKDKYNVNVELVLDDEYNALIYNDECLVKSTTIFTQFFGRMDYLKTKYPNNKLVKHIFSSSWGEISKFSKICKTKEEVLNEKLKFIDKIDFLNNESYENATHIFIEHEVLNNGKEIFTLIPLNDNLYKNNLRILKLFL